MKWHFYNRMTSGKGETFVDVDTDGGNLAKGSDIWEGVANIGGICSLTSGAFKLLSYGGTVHYYPPHFHSLLPLPCASLLSLRGK
jgi:hypothetical protein